MAAVTLAEVAAHAKVSSATVSRVLNGNYPVSEATRARVLRAVEELEYVVNGQASALAAATSDLIGVVVNDIADPFFGIIAGAVQREVGQVGGPGAEAKKLVVVCSTEGSPQRELTYLTLLQRQRAAAIVIIGGAAESVEHATAIDAKINRLAAAGTRIVLCGRPPLTPSDGAKVLTLAFDNRRGAQRLTEHLLTLGHRSMGYIAGPVGLSTTRHRMEGHLAALSAHDVLEGNDVEKLTVHGPYDRDFGYDAALELLERAPHLTAMIGANDALALGACAALRDRGLSIPRDVSVAGFDDLPFTADASPALTTVRLPLAEAGSRAGRLVMGRDTPPPGGVSMIRAELMARASTAPPPETRPAGR